MLSPDTKPLALYFRLRARHASVAVLASAMLTGLLASPSAATEFPPVGDRGDAGAKDVCPAGQFLVGLRARSGAWIDQVSLTCAPLKPDGSLGPQWHGPARGGNGGGPSDKTCAASEIIHGMGLIMTGGNRQVRLFEFDCRSTTSAARHNLDIGNNAPVFPNIVQNCPAGEAATGIAMRYGRHVNAAGLVCGRLPARQPTGSTPGSTSSTTPQPSAVPSDWADMLKAHNDKRALHCAAPLTWNAQLARDAQAYADQCKIGIHGSTGENLADFVAWQTNNGVETPVLPAKSNAGAFQDGWYCEIANYNFDNPTFAGGQTSQCRPPVNGHFTQVVWKDTRELGCGKATCTINGRKGTHWVCRYRPAGNVNVTDPNVLKAEVQPPKPRCR